MKAIIAVVGSKRSGKTTAVEALVKELTKRGYKIATAKHISEEDFTMDTRGKDTWRHAEAGAKTIIAVAPKEVAIIKKKDTANYTLKDIVKNCEKETDLLILEGFRKLIESSPKIPKIVTVKTLDEAVEAEKRFKPILAFTGPAQSIETYIPYIDVLKQPEKLADLIERFFESFS